MSDTCTVIIGAAELLPALKERVQSTGDVLTFADDETATALETISARRPTVVALERVFAATSRGAALIVRLRSDPALGDSEIRVMSHDSDYMRVRHKATSSGARPAKTQSATAVVATPPKPLDYRGTRRAVRFRIAGSVEVRLDGNQATIVDLSTVGAQVISPTILRPNQRVRMAFPDAAGLVRINGTVAWASFELPPGTSAPQYRAGIEFHGANTGALQEFIEKNKELGTKN